MKFRCGDEFLDPVFTHRIAEMCIPEFALENPLLLFFHSATDFEGDTNHFFQFFIRHCHLRIRIQ